MQSQKEMNEVDWKERKISSSVGTRTHNLLLPGKAHYHCAMGELQMVGSRVTFSWIGILFLLLSFHVMLSICDSMNKSPYTLYNNVGVGVYIM